MRPPADVAAEIAVEVDRLVIGVHRRVMTTHRGRIDEVLVPLAVARPGHVYDLAEFLAAGRSTDTVVRRRFVYDAELAASGDLAAVVGRRHPAGSDVPSAPLMRAAEALLIVRAEAADELWGTRARATIDGAATALAAADGELTTAFRSLALPDTPAARLHHLLTGLRYARLDAHVAAWAGAGLSAAEIVALSSAVRGDSAPGRSQPADDAGVQGVRTRGWLTADGAATVAGIEARAAIEARTNEVCGGFFDQLADDHRWLAGIRRLPAGP